MTKEDVAKIVEDLVTIAKVAMPPDLFIQDPRVNRAKALLVSLGRPSSPARPPNVGTDAELEATVHALQGMEMMLDDDLVKPMREAMEHGLPRGDNGTLNFIVREWLIANGYLEPPPEDLN